MKHPLPLKALAVTLALLTCGFGSILGADGPQPGSSIRRMRLYFGTYTSGKSQGIYSSELDEETGELSAPVLAGASLNPSYLAVHPNRQFLYAVNEVSDFQGKRSGAVSAFRIDPADGHLTLLNQQPSGGDGPCHVSVDTSGKDVLVANYGSGSCAAFPIQRDGRLAEASAVRQHHGTSVNPRRQEGPHAHGIYPSPDGRFVLVPDLGLDKVMIYRFDPERGSLEANAPAFGVLAPGSGPRHLTFSPSGRFAYVISEMLCTVTTFRYDAATARLDEAQVVPLLPAADPLRSSYGAAELEIHPSGRFLYGSVRGHDSVSVFAVNAETGKLSLIQSQSSLGKTPRGFDLDPTGRFLIVGNQDSDNVVVFRIDAGTGRLRPTGQILKLGAPVCVSFLQPEK